MAKPRPDAAAGDERDACPTDRKDAVSLAIALIIAVPARPACRTRPSRRARACAATKSRGAQCAAANSLPRRRAMRDLDALAVAGEEHRVLADDVAAAQRREADRARLALAGDAFARVHGAVGERRGRRPRRPLRPGAAPCPTAHRPCACGASRRSRCRSRARARAPPSRRSDSRTLTPTLMLAANTIGIVARVRRAARAFCASSRPVVPTTAATPMPRARARDARACRRAA